MTASTDWFSEAACKGRDPELFFSEHPLNLTARRLCQTCPVQADCLTWALEHNEVGVWGGTTERQRRDMPGRVRKQKGPTGQPAQCGTEGGYRRHLRRGELVCEPCRLAHNQATDQRRHPDRSVAC